MKSNQKKYYQALKNLGNEATTQEIAEKLGVCTKGINQILKNMNGVKHINGKANQSKWKIIS